MPKYTNERMYELVLNKSKSLREETKFKEKLGKHTGASLAVQCIEDRARSLTLMDIVADTVRQGDVAVDLGAGFGILGFAALNAGASFVYSSELNPTLVSFIKDMSNCLGFEKNLVAYEVDARYFHPDKKIDFVIAELVYTGLLQEPIVAAMKHIRQYTNPNALYIPERAISTVKIQQDNIELSHPVVYDDIIFSTNDRTYLNEEITIKILREGLPTHIAINTTLGYPKGYQTGVFKSLCHPIKSRLEGQCISVKPNDKINLHLEYSYGEKVTVAYIN